MRNEISPSLLFMKNQQQSKTDMKQAMKLRVLILTGLFFMGIVCAYAQGGPGGGLDNEDPSATAVPIDGGLGFLLGAGVALGVKKGYDYRNRKKQEAGGK